MKQRDAQASRQQPLGFLAGYGLALTSTALSALARWILPGALTPAPYLGFYPAVVVSAALGGVGPGLFSTFGSLVLVNFVFGRFNINDHGAMMRQVIWVAASVGVSLLAGRQRAARQRAEQEAATARAAERALQQQVELIDPARAEIITREMQRVVRERAVRVEPVAERPGDWVRRGPTLVGAIVTGVGLLVLIGWGFGLDAFKSFVPGLATMKANTALCFFLSGLALALRERRALRLACAAVVCTLACVTLAEYVSGADFHLDQLLFRDALDLHTLFPGRMAEATAVGFLLSGASLLLLGARDAAGRVQQTLAVGVGVIGGIALLGYAYDAQQLYRFAGYSSMALHTAISFAALAVGLVFARPAGLADLLTTPGPAAQLLRRLLPVALLTPAALGWLVNWGLRRGVYGQGMDLALLALAMVLALAALVWWTARAVDRADTARRETETQLRNQAELMQQTREPLIVRELGGAIKFWNHGAEALYGWPAAEAIGQRTHVLLRTQGTPLEQKDARLRETGHWEGELVQTARDGRSVIVESRQTAIPAPDGSVLVLENNRDVTGRKEAEEALRQAKEAAEAANLAKSDFLARMSHEIRTPMNGIMGMTELCLMEPELPQRAREFLGLAKQSSKGLLEIINDILDIARIEAGRVELTERPFDLGASIRDLLAPLRHAAERKGLQLRQRVGEGLPGSVLGDEGRLRQVLTNLVGNAVKFTERGEVEVTVRPSEEPAAPGRTRLLFAVRDTGIGIPPENLSTVFDSFSEATRSTHARYGGTGLGLSIARQLVELMGGRIWAESETGRGSLFHFTAEVGLQGVGSAANERASEDERVQRRGRLNVLVAEDNPLNQIFAQELLRRLGHEVVLAADGEEALRALGRERFDVVLMDVQMPGVNGDEVTRRIRADLVPGCPADLPVIALTAHALRGDQERFLSAGMNDYLSKPFDPDELEDVLRRVAARKGARSPS